MHALVSIAMSAWFALPAGGGSAMPPLPDSETTRLAQSGDSRRQFDEGQAAFNRGDYAAALRMWMPLARQGFAKAQEAVGTLYYRGLGVARDYGEAFGWFRRAADQGDANAPFYLGVMYHDGLGVTQDRAEAARWYRRAAEQGTAAAQTNLGAAYAGGDGVPRDDAEAVRWYRKAAEQGDAWGQNNLAYMVENGRGVARDRDLAIMWYRKAAEQGNATARNNLNRLEAESGAGFAQSTQPASGSDEIVLRLDNGKTVQIFRHTILRDDRGFMHFKIFTFMGDIEYAVDCRSQAWFSKNQGHDQWSPVEPLDDAFFRLVCNNRSGAESGAGPAQERLPNATSDFLRWCDQHGLYAKDSRGWSCAFSIGTGANLTAMLGRQQGCGALKSRIDGFGTSEDGIERAGAALSTSILPWLRANIGALSNDSSADMKSAISSLYACSM